MLRSRSGEDQGCPGDAGALQQPGWTTPDLLPDSPVPQTPGGSPCPQTRGTEATRRQELPAAPPARDQRQEPVIRPHQEPPGPCSPATLTRALVMGPLPPPSADALTPDPHLTPISHPTPQPLTQSQLPGLTLAQSGFCGAFPSPHSARPTRDPTSPSHWRRRGGRGAVAGRAEPQAPGPP